MERKATTIIFKRDGRHHLTLQCTTADAERWAEEHEVFRIIVHGGQWAMNHVNSGKIVTNELASDSQEAAQAFLQLERKEM